MGKKRVPTMLYLMGKSEISRNAYHMPSVPNVAPNWNGSVTMPWITELKYRLITRIVATLHTQWPRIRPALSGKTLEAVEKLLSGF